MDKTEQPNQENLLRDMSEELDKLIDNYDSNRATEELLKELTAYER